MERRHRVRWVLWIWSLTIFVPSSLAAQEPDKPWWPWLLIGAGGAAAVGGSVTWYQGEADYSTVDDAIADAGRDANSIIPMTQVRAQSLQDSGDTKTLWGPVLVGLGAAVAATGTLLLLHVEPSAETDVYPAQFKPLLIPVAFEDGGGAALAFSF